MAKKARRIKAVKKLNSKRPKIIAVILAYNVASMLARALERIPKDLVDDIIVMDDGSKDGTSEVAKKLGLKVFRHVPNRGYGGNLKAGMEQAMKMGADYIVEIHGDGAQFNPIALKLALPHMRNGADLVLGSRFQVPGQALKNGMPLIRFLANRGLSFFDRIVLRLPLTEFHTGFRIYSTKFLKRVPYKLNENNYVFSFEIIAQAAYFDATVKEVPVEADYHAEHTSHKLSGAAAYALKTFVILGKYILARWKISYSSIFPHKS